MCVCVCVCVCVRARTFDLLKESCGFVLVHADPLTPKHIFGVCIFYVLLWEQDFWLDHSGV